MAVAAGTPMTTHEMLNKVPEVTLAFWVIKVMATTVGETGADYLAVRVGLGRRHRRDYAALLLPSLWCSSGPAAMCRGSMADRRPGERRRHPDHRRLTDRLDVAFTPAPRLRPRLGRDLRRLYASGGTLSIHTITTSGASSSTGLPSCSLFALGTAAGDLATRRWPGLHRRRPRVQRHDRRHLLAYHLVGNAVLTFWIAYVLTRPLGASLGDLPSQSRRNGGLGLGTVGTSLVFLPMIVTLVTVVSIGRNQPGSRERAVGDVSPPRSTTLPP